jgi:Mn-dependent DtxR family transcriptional regulator
MPREAHGAPRCATQHDDALRIVRSQLGTSVWTKKDIARVLKIEERTAQETIASWKQSGLIEDTGRLGRYTLTEGA